MFKLLKKKSYRDLVVSIRSKVILKGEPRISSAQHSKFIKDSKEYLACYLQKEGYPLNWVDPLFRTIVNNDEIVELPLDDGIALRVINVPITSNGPADPYFVMDEDTPVVDKKIYIEISGMASVGDITRFVKKNSHIIKFYQDLLELPSLKRNKMALTEVAYKIYDMKRNKKMTFKQIADSSEMEELNILDENSIKTLYYRYKKTFSPTK